MSAEILFIFDSHCPWSYATTQLVAEAKKAIPALKVRLFPCGYYDGDNGVSATTVKEVQALSNVPFGENYLESLGEEASPYSTKDSTMVSNIIAWAQNKNSQQALEILQALQKMHFVDGNPLTQKQDVEELVNAKKLSLPGKSLQSEKFTKDAEFAIHDVEELQEMIGTQAIPAVLLVVNDDLVLLNHNLYLGDSKMFIDSIKLELK